MNKVRKCGTKSGYAGGCRCQWCKEANRLAQALYRKKVAMEMEQTVPGYRVRRRLRALAALGWRREDIKRELGLATTGSLSYLLDKGEKNVYMRTFLKVDAMYRRLCMTIGPSKSLRVRCKNKGWKPPLAWDDIDDPQEEELYFDNKPGKKATAA